MNSIERSLAPIVHQQREELTDLNNQLKALNEQYPEERKKPFAKRNPMYEAQRNPILNRRIELQGSQHLKKEQLKRL